MRTIYAEYNINHDSIDVYTSAGYMLRIDCWEAEKNLKTTYGSSKDIATEHLGLGLNISKILSERHGGNIQIANNKAGGACVTVKINCNES